MGRLTYRYENGIAHLIETELKDACEYCYDAAQKLAHYEDLEEQGRLIELPCKVGDTVYVIDYEYEEMYEPSSKYPIILEHEFELYMITELGTWVFLTKEEAEARLKEGVE